MGTMMSSPSSSSDHTSRDKITETLLAGKSQRRMPGLALAHDAQERVCPATDMQPNPKPGAVVLVGSLAHLPCHTTLRQQKECSSATRSTLITTATLMKRATPMARALWRVTFGTGRWRRAKEGLAANEPSMSSALHDRPAMGVAQGEFSEDEEVTEGREFGFCGSTWRAGGK